MDLKCASFFAGVGGIDLGFHQAGFETIYANEFDDYAADTFEKNFKIKVDRRDINIVPTDEIPNFDILLAGFPCQAFSIAGYQQGFDDEKGRGNLFFELIRIMKTKKPRIAFFENVKNLVSHDKGNTFRVICEQLDSLGYKYIQQVMNACEYGNVPREKRLRYSKPFTKVKNKAKYPEICRDIGQYQGVFLMFVKVLVFSWCLNLCNKKIHSNTVRYFADCSGGA